MSRWLKGEPVEVGRRAWWRFWAPRRWRFAEGGAFEHGPVGSALVTEIPAGFVFDNSMPWFLAWLFPRQMRRRMRRGCGLHDWLRTRRAWSLAAGDAAFMDAIACDAVREPWLTAAWWGVRTNKSRRFPPADTPDPEE